VYREVLAQRVPMPWAVAVPAVAGLGAVGQERGWGLLLRAALPTPRDSPHGNGPYSFFFSPGAGAGASVAVCFRDASGGSGALATLPISVCDR